MEKLDMRKLRCQAKVIGTIVTVAGAMLMTLYKGQVINFLGSQYMHHPRNYVPENTTDSGEKDWFKGSILLIIATLAWASFFILQAVTLRKYPAQKMGGWRLWWKKPKQTTISRCKRVKKRREI
ncbi:WAT1-related protein At5g07050-like [Vigna umbellata]|uniref:WAT1-related protein At5g07050-like n=1 Tax=Vigna umbellata TaxID=87088 RepID=UPI001F5F5298|nr:WAT1-related protein At5g07050-like [Vigna umbellata]